jgi:carbamoyl-phosphate synthase large subunit
MKKLLWIVEYLTWNIRCRYEFWLHGPYGLTRTLEEMPLFFLLKYMRKYGASIGTGVVIDSGLKLHRPDSKIPLKNLTIGNDVYIGHRIILDMTDKITFEDNIAIGADCQIWTHVGDFNYEMRNSKEGALCYSSVIVNPNSILDKKSRVLAMSMVSGHIPENQIWAGVPAKLIKERTLLTKSILIFGAGINQLTLIQNARRLGIRAVVIDPSDNPPGKSKADVFYQVPAQDYESTRQIALNEKVDGIITSQMENPLRLMAHLALDLGFIFHTPQIVEHCRNKFLMKQVFLDNNIPCAKGLLVKHETEITEQKFADSGLIFPLIVKPTDAHSSQGVVKVDNYTELISAVKKAVLFSTDGAAVIEEFMDGPEYSIETITFRGQTHIIQFTEKIITPYPNTVELGHIQPANLTQQQKDELRQLVVRTIDALQIDNSASHMEVKCCTSGFKVVEVGARLGGDFISSYLTKASTGIDMDKASIQVALGLPPDVKQLRNRFSYIKYVELPVGKKVREVIRESDEPIFDNLVFLHIFVNPGDIIPPIEHSGQRPACFIVSADSLHEVKEIAEQIDSIVRNKLIKLI